MSTVYTMCVVVVYIHVKEKLHAINQEESHQLIDLIEYRPGEPNKCDKETHRDVSYDKENYKVHRKTVLSK